MAKLDEVEYIRQVTQANADKNCKYRFTTQYLSAITSEEIQTTDGVILIDEPPPEKLTHNDWVMVLGRCIKPGRFEGSLTKLDQPAV